MNPYYEDDTCTIYHADVQSIVDLGDVACVVTSPPYNAGVEYEGHDDNMEDADYRALAKSACEFIALSIDRQNGRAWMNIGVSRLFLWAASLVQAGLTEHSTVCWDYGITTSNTAWGSWKQPTAPHLRFGWEPIIVARAREWARTAPAGLEDYKDPGPDWATICRNVWRIPPGASTNVEHPAVMPLGNRIKGYPVVDVADRDGYGPLRRIWHHSRRGQAARSQVHRCREVGALLRDSRLEVVARGVGSLMAWIRFDDKRATHRKLRAAGFEARGLDEAAICWCGHEETDGFLSDDDLEALATFHKCPLKRAKTLAQRLIDVGRWERDDDRGGYGIHDALDYTPSRNELEIRRDSDRKRKRNLNGTREAIEVEST